MTLTLMPRIALAAAAALCVGACDEARGPTGPGVEIEVAPLSYPGLNRVCYDLTVLNGDPDGDDAPDVVWSEQGLCSDRYGNGAGGDISYVGPCDADVANKNYVQLTVADVYVGATAVLLDQIDVGPGGSHEGEDDDYRNPCPTGAPCTLDFACLENRDVSVVFNLTVMRDANQGFFDVAVNFDDIFCSAKFDTCYPGEDPENADDDEYILQLHDATGQRRQTAVLGFACTGGALTTAEAASETHLYMNDIVVTCGPDAVSLAQQIAAIDSQIEVLNVEVETKTTVKFGLEEQLMAAQIARQQIIRDRESTQNTLNQRQAALNGIIAQVDTLQQQVAACEILEPPCVELADLQSDLSDALAAQDDLNAQIGVLQQTRAQLDNQLNQRNREIQEILDQYSVLTEQIEALGRQREQLAGDKSALEAQLANPAEFRLSPSAGHGNIYSTTTTPALDTADSGAVWQYAVYAGREQLNCGGTAPEYEPATVTWGAEQVVHHVYKERAGSTMFLMSGNAQDGFDYYLYEDEARGAVLDVADNGPNGQWQWGVPDQDTGIPMTAGAPDWEPVMALVDGTGWISCDKVYWNVAIGIEGLPAGCTISTTATASAGVLEYDVGTPDWELFPPGDDEAVPVPGITPVRTTYPIVVLDEVPLTDANGVICGQYPLNLSGDAFYTDYTRVDEPAAFGHELTPFADGTVHLDALDPDHAPMLANTYALNGSTTIDGEVGDFVSGSLMSLDIFDWYRFDLGAGLSLESLSPDCRSAAPGEGQPAIAIQLFDAVGRSLTGGFKPCDGALDLERGGDIAGETVYALVVAVNPAQPSLRFHGGFFRACISVLGLGSTGRCFEEAWYLTISNEYTLTFATECDACLIDLGNVESRLEGVETLVGNADTLALTFGTLGPTPLADSVGEVCQVTSAAYLDHLDGRFEDFITPLYGALATKEAELADRESEAEVAESNLEVHMAALAVAEAEKADATAGKANKELQCEAWRQAYAADTLERNAETNFIRDAEAIVAVRLDTLSSWLQEYLAQDGNNALMGAGPSICPDFANSVLVNRITLAWPAGLVLIADLVEERDLETDPGLIAELDAKIAEAQSLLVTIADYNSTLLQIGACETPLATEAFPFNPRDLARMLQETREDLILQQSNADMLHAVREAECEAEIAAFDQRIDTANNLIDEARVGIALWQSEIDRLTTLIQLLITEIAQLQEEIDEKTDVYDEAAATYAQARQACVGLIDWAIAGDLLGNLLLSDTARSGLTVHEACDKVCE